MQEPMTYDDITVEKITKTCSYILWPQPPYDNFYCYFMLSKKSYDCFELQPLARRLISRDMTEISQTMGRDAESIMVFKCGSINPSQRNEQN